MLRHCSSSNHNQDHQHQSTAAASPATMAAAAASTTFSLFFPMPDDTKSGHGHRQCADGFGFDDDSHSSVTTSPSSPSSSSTGSVDCTLSLGTPSSRRAAAETAKQPSCGAVSWNVAAGAADQSCCCCCCQGGSTPAAAAAAAAMNKTPAVPCAGHGHGQDPLLVDRRCANCGTSSTPLWRNGPRGPKTLCNACGIRFKKEQRRAAAAAMDQAGGCGYFAQRAQYGAAAAAATGRAAPASYGGCDVQAFPFGGGGDIVADAEAAVPPQFLAWRLDVVAPAAQAAAFAAVWPERTTLFQYN